MRACRGGGDRAPDRGCSPSGRRKSERGARARARKLGGGRAHGTRRSSGAGARARGPGAREARRGRDRRRARALGALAGARGECDARPRPTPTSASARPSSTRRRTRPRSTRTRPHTTTAGPRDSRGLATSASPALRRSWCIPGEWQRATVLCREVLEGEGGASARANGRDRRARPRVRAPRRAWSRAPPARRGAGVRDGRARRSGWRSRRRMGSRASTDLEAKDDEAAERMRALLARWQTREERHYSVSAFRWATTLFARRREVADAGCVRGCAREGSPPRRVTPRRWPHSPTPSASSHSWTATPTAQRGSSRRRSSSSRTASAPNERAETQVRAAVALAAVGKLQAAVDRLTDAYRTARKLGARPLASSAAEELQALGESVERFGLGRALAAARWRCSASRPTVSRTGRSRRDSSSASARSTCTSATCSPSSAAGRESRPRSALARSSSSSSAGAAYRRYGICGRANTASWPLLVAALGRRLGRVATKLAREGRDRCHTSKPAILPHPRRRRRCRRRRRSSSTSPACTRAPEWRRPTSSPSSTPRRATSSTRRRCRTPATSSTTSAGTAARSACHGPDRSHLIVPGFRSSRIHIVNVADDPRRPRIEKVIEPEELIAKTGYTRPHTVHCMPGDNVVVSHARRRRRQRRRRVRRPRRADVRGQGPLGERRRDAAVQLRLLVPAAQERARLVRVRRAERVRVGVRPRRREAAATGSRSTSGTSSERTLEQTVDLGETRARSARGALEARSRRRGGLRRCRSLEHDVALPQRQRRLGGRAGDRRRERRARGLAVPGARR